MKTNLIFKFVLEANIAFSILQNYRNLTLQNQQIEPKDNKRI